MRVFPRIDLTELCVPWDQGLSVYVGAVQRGLIREMQRLCYDQGPVLAENGSVLGLVTLERLTELASAGAALVQDDPQIIHTEIDSHPGLDVLLDFFAEQQAAIVVSHASTELGDHEWTHGFVTLSDLNRHPLRTVIYPLFAELEVELAERIRRFYDDPWDWLAKLDKDKQARLVGYWEMAKRDNVDVGPAAGTMLSELQRIVGGTRELREQLGFSSRNKWDDYVGKLADLRNGVMHPVRPLFTSQNDVADVREQLGRVLVLLKRLDACGERRGDARTDHITTEIDRA